MFNLFSCVTPVSYTHLDVYKRQDLFCFNDNFRQSKSFPLNGHFISIFINIYAPIKLQVAFLAR